MASSTPGGEVRPVISPPPTEFPFPAVDSEGSDATRVGSDSNVPDERSSAEANGQIHQRQPERYEPVRPNLQAARFNTERPRVVPSGSVLAIRRTRTGSGNATEIPEHLDPWDSSSSSEEDEPTLLQKVRTAPEGQGQPRPGLLNRTTTFTRRKRSDPHSYSRFSVENEGFQSRGKVSKTDGRLKISVNETANTGYLAKALGATIQHHLRPLHKEPKIDEARQDLDVPESKLRRLSPSGLELSPPSLNIVIMVIGSRGDIQPFLKIGKTLKEKHGHRVRIATHPAFREFVEQDSGLDFFSVGGDPSELMAFMVKNPGLIPSMATVKAGEIGRRRHAMFEMFQGFWRACINATDEEKDLANIKMMGDKAPFVADAIIANPPSFAHVHCAERLGVPLHLMFTFPYSPTTQFPHPLANIKQTNVDKAYTNFMSYPLVEMMTWQGLGDLVNSFRVTTLGLEPMSTLWAPGQLFRLKVPYTYLWSPALVPKPSDWGPEIDIAGFVYLDLASSFSPPDALSKFLNAGEPPVYIGFGSIVVDDPDSFTRLIFEAVQKAGVRALVSKGWGGLGGDTIDIPENIYLLGNTPHDWLFPQVSAVVHHGGAGTTAIGLKCGKPTMIVPFFGDQPFWGSMVAKAGAGAEAAIPYKRLTADNLAKGIKQCLSKSAKEKALEIAKCIAEEGDGAENAVDSFHRNLPLKGEKSMRCSIFPDRVAIWSVKKTDIHISALAADFLVESRRLRWQDLRLLRHYNWTDFQGGGEPVTAATGAIVNTTGAVVKGLASIPGRTRRSLQAREKLVRKKKKKTVQDAILLPGEVAEKRMSNATLPDSRNDTTNNTVQVNLQGKAKPAQCPVPLADSADVPFAESENAEAEGAVLTPQQLSGASAGVPSIPATIAKSTAVGLGDSAAAIAAAPIDFALAVSQGFHNAPRLYGDKTVRESPSSVTGIRSGLLAARDELRFGFFDAAAGLLKQPYLDTKEYGPIGVATGMSKGIGGLVLKPLAGMFGITAYVGKGLQAEARKRFRDVGRTERWIRRARITQGGLDVKKLAEQAKLEGRGRTRKDHPGKTVQEMRARAVEAWKKVEKEREADMLDHSKGGVFKKAGHEVKVVATKGHPRSHKVR